MTRKVVRVKACSSIPRKRTIQPAPALLAASNSTLMFSTARTKKNRHQRLNGEAPDDSLAELLSSYTPKQRWSLLKGFRILAKVAVRAHMERQVPGSKTVPNGGGEEED